MYFLMTPLAVKFQNIKPWYKTQLQGLQQQIRAKMQQFMLWQEQTKSTILQQPEYQFGFVAHSTKTTHHKTSIHLVAMPYWYNFSLHLHLAHHKFT